VSRERRTLCLAVSVVGWRGVRDSFGASETLFVGKGKDEKWRLLARGWRQKKASVSRTDRVGGLVARR